MTWLLSALTVIGIPAAIYGPIYAWLSTLPRDYEDIDFE
jgi:hypothetical protein